MKSTSNNKKWSEERKKKMSLIMMGHRDFTKGILRWNKGKTGLQVGYWNNKTRDDETKTRISLSRKGKGTGESNGNFKHGLCSDKKYLSWIKNLWHKRNKSAEGSHSFLDWNNLKEKYNFTCPICGRKEPDIKLTIDHVIPLSKNGTNYISNIQPLCKSCNSSKHNKIINDLART